MTEHPIVLVIDDEVRSQESLRRVLGEEFEVLTAGDAEEAESLLQGEMVHAILCDQRMPGMTGVDFLKRARGLWPDTVRMIVSGYTDSEDIIAGVNEAGIYQYITKPWEPEELLDTVRGAIRLFNLQQDNQIASVEMKLAPGTLERIVARKKATLKSNFGFERIICSEDSPLRAACSMARKIAEFDISVLITGESGTGKELLAHAIHYGSGRLEKPFVVQNCGALPDELLESELFGCKKGAFTGAYRDRIGLFEQATRGTIFLDEISDTSPAFQVKLLRVLQEGEIRPLGARLTRKVDVRVIAATNRELEEEMRAGRFRRDLYYRLAAFPLHLPPLRERPMDIPLLAELMMGEVGIAFGKPVKGFSKEALARLRRYHWPGNVRELRNEIQRMIALCDGDVLGVDALSERVRTASRGKSGGPGSGDGSLKERVEMMEKRIISDALQRHRWNISRAADELGLSRVGLRGKLQRYGVEHGKPS
jgi:two-component system response regulator HupR/HoxA